MHLMSVALHEMTWCMAVWCTQNLHLDGNSFMWHQPCQRCKYTTLVDIQKRAKKKKKKKNAIHSCRITCERSGSARERRIALHKSDQQQWQCLAFCLSWRHWKQRQKWRRSNSWRWIKHAKLQRNTIKNPAGNCPSLTWTGSVISRFWQQKTDNLSVDVFILDLARSMCVI